jgi:hypothetical protein
MTMTLRKGANAMPKYPEHVIQWQLDRMDYTRDSDGNWIEGEPTREDAIALLDSLEEDSE